METQNALTWFEIPVRDMGRAQTFYERVLGTKIQRQPMGPNELGLFAYDAAKGVGGCLTAGSTVPEPSASGTLVYLDAGPSMDAALIRVWDAGGTVTTPKTALPGDMGCFARIADTEGNCVGLHAPG